MHWSFSKKLSSPKIFVYVLSKLNAQLTINSIDFIVLTVVGGPCKLRLTSLLYFVNATTFHNTNHRTKLPFCNVFLVPLAVLTLLWTLFKNAIFFFSKITLLQCFDATSSCTGVSLKSNLHVKVWGLRGSYSGDIWDVTPRSLVKILRRFRGIYCLSHAKGWYFIPGYTASRYGRL